MHPLMPLKGKLTSITRLGMIKHIIIHMELRWTTTWSQAGGDTIISKSQMTRTVKDDATKRAGLGLCSADALGGVTTREPTEHN